MNMRLLITGGAGCLGSNLIERYLPAGHEIFVIDNFATGKRATLPETSGLTLRKGHVADKALVDACFVAFQPTHVIHSAASYKDPSDWTEDAASNVTGTINVVQAAEAAGVKRLVYFQTALCYGRPKRVPIPVDHPLAPFTSYGISKTAGEQFALMGNVPALSLRLANVTGPRLTIGPIPTFYKRLKGGQSCFCSDTVRDFLDMEDFFSFMDLCLRENAPTGVYNLSSGEGHSIREIFDIVADHLRLNPPEPPLVPCGADDVPAVILDATRTGKDFGWRPQYSFDATIRRLLAWYDEHGVSDIFSHLRQPAQPSNPDSSSGFQP